MLNENLVLTLLQASVAGVGLVLAVYALVIPLWRRISKHRAKVEYRMYEAFRKQVAQVKQPSADQTSELGKMLDVIETYQSLPAYFGLLILVTLIGYVVSTFLSLWWVLGWYRDLMDYSLSPVFGFSTFLFIIVGIATIYVVTTALNRESEEFKRKMSG